MSESNPQAVRCRGVRCWPPTADGNTREEILQATRQLLALMIRQNGIDPADVASAIFTTTVDLDAEFPAALPLGNWAGSTWHSCAITSWMCRPRSANAFA